MYWCAGAVRVLIPLPTKNAEEVSVFCNGLVFGKSVTVDPTVKVVDDADADCLLLFFNVSFQNGT